MKIYLAGPSPSSLVFVLRRAEKVNFLISFYDIIERRERFKTFNNYIRWRNGEDISKDRSYPKKPRRGANYPRGDSTHNQLLLSEESENELS